MSDDTALTSDAPADNDAPVNSDTPVDALDSLESADLEIDKLLTKWREDTSTLEEGDDVDVRWERGSAVKLLLQHFAVRESAIDAISARLHTDGHDELAGRLEGDRVARRTAIARLDEEVRGHQAMTLNTPEVDRAVMALGEMFDTERAVDRDEVEPAVVEALGVSGERDLPSVRQVQTRAVTHPSPEPGGFTDRVGPLKAVRALYQHLRGTPSGGTSPSVDDAREHVPGL